MIEKLQKRFEENKKYKMIVEKVYKNPYIEFKDIYKGIDASDQQFFQTALEQLIEDFILIELTSQAGSNIESRVPKKLLIINPDIEEELETLM